MTGKASLLPSDVLALVFQRLQPSPPNGYCGQEAFWQVPLVCRNFRDAFAQHLAMGCHIYLDVGMMTHHSVSLLEWLQKHPDTVNSFEMPYWSDAGDSDVEAFFSILSRCRSLASLAARPKSTSELELVAMLKSLTSCHLKPSHDLDLRCLDLLPLQGLSKLTTLKLQEGTFTNVSAAKHLRSLDLVYARALASTACSFSSSLTRLEMAHSRLVELHSRGLLGCTALRSLHLHKACQISADTQADVLQTDSECCCRFPADTTTLVSLTEVQFCAYHCFESAEILGFCNLPNLKRLQIEFSDGANCTRPFEGLSRLTSLSFVLAADFSTMFSFQWQALQALQHLEISGEFAVDATFLGIAMLPCLHSVQLICAETQNKKTDYVLRELLQRLSAMKVYVERNVGNVKNDALSI